MHSSASSDIASAVSPTLSRSSRSAIATWTISPAHETAERGGSGLTVGRVDRGAIRAHRGNQPVDSLGARLEKNFRPSGSGQRQLGCDQLR